MAVVPRKLFHVKTEFSFTAEDPWNGNACSPFTIEDYIDAPAGSAIGPDAKPFGQDFIRCIRCSANGVERRVPDSLSSLWRDQQIPAEAIPRLMKEMEPSLQANDYEVLLNNKLLPYVLAFFVTLLVAAAALVLSCMFLYPKEVPAPFGIALLLFLAGFTGWFSHHFYFRKMGRRKRQKEWILSRP